MSIWEMFSSVFWIALVVVLCPHPSFAVAAASSYFSAAAAAFAAFAFAAFAAAELMDVVCSQRAHPYAHPN